MERLLEAVQKSCDEGNWYAALYVALTLPDICASMETSKKDGIGERYRAWFDRHLAATYTQDLGGRKKQFLTARDMWKLRCRLLHTGSDEIAAVPQPGGISRFKFSTTGPHCNAVDDVLCLDVATFCSDVCNAARAWLIALPAESPAHRRIADMALVETGTFSPVWGVSIGREQ